MVPNLFFAMIITNFINYYLVVLSFPLLLLLNIKHPLHRNIFFSLYIHPFYEFFLTIQVLIMLLKFLVNLFLLVFLKEFSFFFLNFLKKNLYPLLLITPVDI